MRYFPVILILLGWVWNACQPNHAHEHEANQAPVHANDNHDDHDHSHSHERPVFSLTVFERQNELFVEFPALVKGHTSQLVAHFTQLQPYHPFRHGKVRAVLGPWASDWVPMNRTGIFLPELIPGSEGAHTLRVEWKHNAQSVTFTLGNYQVYATEADAAHQAKPEAHQHDATAITFLKERAWKTDFAVAQVNPQPFDEVISCTGEIIPAQNDEIGIIAPVSGIISLKKALLPGSPIRKGFPLATVSDASLANSTESQYQKAKAAYELAKKQRNRIQKLVTDNILPKKREEEARNQYIRAKAELENIARNYTNAGKQVTAPAAGVIAKLVVGEGEFVEAGQLLAKMHVEKSFMLRADVPKFQAKALNRIQDAHFIPEYTDSAFTVTALGGRRLPTDLITDDQSAYIPVFFELPLSQGIIPHSYARVFLQAPAGKSLLSVPNSALMENEGTYWVYVQHGGEEYLRREVQPGPNNGKRTAIKKGLQPGEYVVVQGAYQVKQASMSNTVPAHAHAH